MRSPIDKIFRSSDAECEHGLVTWSFWVRRQGQGWRRHRLQYNINQRKWSQKITPERKNKEGIICQMMLPFLDTDKNYSVPPREGGTIVSILKAQLRPEEMGMCSTLSLIRKADG